MNQTEEKIRGEIYEALDRNLFYRGRLHEGGYAVNVSPGEFSKIFIEPWKNALKNAYIELKKVASQAILTIRLMFTLNQEKAKLIIARHKDRMKQFEKESEAVFQALGGDRSAGDFNLMIFAMNPGLFLGRKMASGAYGAGEELIQFGKEIGLGDKSIKTVIGDEPEEDAEMRRRDQRGPIAKALKALEQIFLLAHAEPSGSLISEAADYSGLTDEIMSGPLGEALRGAQEGMVEDIQEFVDLVESTAAQNAFLSVIARIETVNDPQQGLQEMQVALNDLKRIDPEAASEFESLPSDILSEAKKLAASEKFQSDVTERYPDKPDIDFEKEALIAVMGQTFGENMNEYMSVINENMKLIDDTFDQLFPEEVMNKDLIAALDSQVQGFGDAIRTVEKLLQKRIIA